jgi:hypothetical protein
MLRALHLKDYYHHPAAVGELDDDAFGSSEGGEGSAAGVAAVQLVEATSRAHDVLSWSYYQLGETARALQHATVALELMGSRREIDIVFDDDDNDDAGGGGGGGSGGGGGGGGAGSVAEGAQGERRAARINSPRIVDGGDGSGGASKHGSDQYYVASSDASRRRRRRSWRQRRGVLSSHSSHSSSVSSSSSSSSLPRLESRGAASTRVRRNLRSWTALGRLLQDPDWVEARQSFKRKDWVEVIRRVVAVLARDESGGSESVTESSATAGISAGRGHGEEGAEMGSMVGEDAEADGGGGGINGINEGVEAGIDWEGWEGGSGDNEAQGRRTVPSPSPLPSPLVALLPQEKAMMHEYLSWGYWELRHARLALSHSRAAQRLDPDNTRHGKNIRYFEFHFCTRAPGSVGDVPVLAWAGRMGIMSRATVCNTGGGGDDNGAGMRGVCANQTIKGGEVAMRVPDGSMLCMSRLQRLLLGIKAVDYPTVSGNARPFGSARAVSFKTTKTLGIRHLALAMFIAVEKGNPSSPLQEYLATLPFPLSSHDHPLLYNEVRGRRIVGSSGRGGG